MKHPLFAFHFVILLFSLILCNTVWAQKFPVPPLKNPLENARTLEEWGWTADRGLYLVKAHVLKDAFWVAHEKIGPNGILRASFALGKRPDSSFFYRAKFPENPAAVDGYSLTFEKKSVLIHRWEGGYAFPITDEVKLKRVPKRANAEVIMNGATVDIVLYDEQKKDVIAKLHSDDLAYIGDETGYRAYKKQDRNSALLGFQFTPSTTPSPLKVDDHPEAYRRTQQRIYVAAPSGQSLDGLKACQREKNADIQGFDIYRCNHTAMMALVDENRMLPLGFYWFANRQSMNDSEYRRAARDLNCKTPMHCKKNTPLDPNRSAKDTDMVQAYLDAYANVCARRFKSVRLETVGSSYLGHPMRALVLTNAKSRHVPRVLFNGAHHGVELLATDMAFDVLEELCETSDENAQKHYESLLAKAEVWVIPLVNLDGADMFFHASVHLGRKNGRGVFSQYTKNENYLTKSGNPNSPSVFYRYHPNTTAVGAGVDINRNYPLQWGATGERSSSGRPRDYWYRGTAPASEPEIQSIMNLFHAEQFAASLSFHTLSTKILSPYSIDALQNPPQERDLPWQLALRMAEAAGVQANGRRYEVVKNLYSVDGTDQDWFRMMSGTYAYLIEGPLHNPTGKKRRDALVKSRPAWQTFLDAVPQSTRITVKDTQGHPLLAEVHYSDESSQNGEHWLTRCDDGSHTMLCTGPREVTVTLLNGDSKTQKLSCKPGAQTSAEFVFERPKEYEEWRVIQKTNVSLFGVDALCDLKNHTCPHLPALRYCLIDDACIAAGTPSEFGVCNPIENNRDWSQER